MGFILSFNLPAKPFHSVSIYLSRNHCPHRPVSNTLGDQKEDREEGKEGEKEGRRKEGNKVLTTCMDL